MGKTGLCAILASFCLAALAAAQEPTGHFDVKGMDVLFDGKSLDGWVTKGGHYDGNATWTVEDGAIKGVEGPDHAGGLIYTAQPYTNFIFVCDCKMTYPFDSGVFLRMAPNGKGAQVTLDYRDDGEIGAVYADGFLAHNETAKAKWKKDEWNRVEVRFVGKDYHCEAWLNGEKITDYQLPKDAPGYAPTGLIGLQVHGARNDPNGSYVKFKNVCVRELPEFDPALFTTDDRGVLTPTEAGVQAGWKPLFNAKDLDGWETTLPKNAFAVRDGMMIFPSVAGDGDIHTKADYRDFELTLDWKIGTMANSGVFLRAARDGSNPAFSGCEIQILDDFNWESTTHSKLKEWQFSGSLYGSAAPADRGAIKPLMRWNRYDITYEGSRIKTLLNGKLLYDVDTFAMKPHPEAKPFAERARTGFIGLQRHAGGEVQKPEYAWFRNIFIRAKETK